jgi:hypothetical protein
MLKQFKTITLAPICFGSRRIHHQEAVLCLTNTSKYGFSALIGIEAVNIMAAYQPVAQTCGSQWRQDFLHNRLICRQNNDCLYTDERGKTIL